MKTITLLFGLLFSITTFAQSDAILGEWYTSDKEAVVTMCFGLPAFIKKSIGLKKIPPPIPTTPEMKPKIPPIKIEIIIGTFLYLSSLSSYDLKFNNNNIPAIVKTRNNNISNNHFSISKEPPINAKGIEPIK